MLQGWSLSRPSSLTVADQFSLLHPPVPLGQSLIVQFHCPIDTAYLSPSLCGHTGTTERKSQLIKARKCNKTQVWKENKIAFVYGLLQSYDKEVEWTPTMKTILDLTQLKQPSKIRS